MLQVSDDWIRKQNNIDKSFFQEYNEETGLIKKDKVDYKIPKSLYKRLNTKFYIKKNMPQGSMSQAFFMRGECVYSMLGMSHACGGPHLFPFKAEGNPKYGGNSVHKYNLRTDEWTDIGELKTIKPMGGMINWVYHEKFYLLGGYAFQRMDPEFLKEYEKKYKKWPEKKGEWYSSDLREITVNENDEITEREIPLQIFTNTIMSHLQIGNKIYFTGGVNGKLQKCWLTSKELSEYIKDVKWKQKIDKMGDKIYLGSFIFFLDMENIEEGVQIETFFPGVPCMSYELIERNNYIYLFSSHTYTDSHWCSFRPGERNRLSCPDNWKYNLQSKEWIRLKDWPLRSLCSRKVIRVGDKALIYGGNNAFMETSIDYFQKMNSEFKYFTIENYKNMITHFPHFRINYKRDDTGRWFCPGELQPYFKFGSVSNKVSYFNENDQQNVTGLDKIKSYDYFQHYFSDLIMFYDFEDDKYYFSEYNFPTNIAGLTSKAVVYNDDVFVFGGESNDILFNNKFPQISSCLVLQIKIDED
jgi:hypothetical protein